ncbi:MAG: tetrahydromethanopterin S-methyltransferase subunit H [Methanotrichaceae archaeon]|nr:tetrahydromethanopterin S-methyltransferase subunit H [Methanotrichaceae archaeon]
MFRFEREQTVANVGGVRLGGQPGEHPTVLCGTIFYQGQRLVQDEDRGLFDRERAEALINRQAELSQETGNPAILHLFSRTAQAFERYLEFVEATWDGPLIIDSADSRVRSAMAGLVSELGLADLVVYNSLSLATGDEEAQALQESEIDSAIVLAYNPAVPGVDGSMAVLETGGTVRDQGLIPLAGELGMKNLLLDPGVVPLGSGAGAALRFSVVAKARLGLPVGSGIHNAVSAWSWLKGKDRQTRSFCDAAAAAMQLLAAGDFLLYGPIENASSIFPVAAMSDILVAEAVRDLEVWPVPEHPIFRLA